MKMASTIKDIAKHTGLGLATISKYLNGGNVRVKNKIAIEKAIAELDYTANAFARGLKTKRSQTIGVVIPELSNLFITSILTTVQDILRRNGYAILVSDCRTNPFLEAQAVQFLVHKGVDGIINMPVSHDGAHLRLAVEKKLPIVIIDRMLNDPLIPVNAVMVDNVQASRDAVRFLLANGHRHIGIIVGPEEIYTSKQRLQGYKDAVLERERGIEERLILCSDYSLTGGYESMKKLLSDCRDMTAVLVTNYDMTLGAIIALNELGVKMPQELSFIGFDNLPLSRVVRPQLTIVAQPMERIGEQAALLMLTQLKRPGDEPGRVVMLPTQMQMGDSVQRIEVVSGNA